MSVRQLPHERIGQTGQGVIDRVADVAVVHAHAVPRGNQLDDLAGVEGTVHGVERGRIRSAFLGDRIGDLAQCRSYGMDPGEHFRTSGRLGGRLLTPALRALVMDDPTFDEPGEGGIERWQPIHRETLLDVEGVLKVVGVHEVERALQRDVVSVVRVGRLKTLCCHRGNHYIALDRLRARGYSHLVTGKTR